MEAFHCYFNKINEKQGTVENLMDISFKKLIEVISSEFSKIGHKIFNKYLKQAQEIHHKKRLFFFFS